MWHLYKVVGIVSLVFTLSFISCGSSDNRLFMVEKTAPDGKSLYGYVNSRGDTIIKCEYSYAEPDTIVNLGFVWGQEKKFKCYNNKGKFLFYVCHFDNGPDYPQEGLFRIFDEKGRIGFADTLGNIVVAPPIYICLSI